MLGAVLFDRRGLTHALGGVGGGGLAAVAAGKPVGAGVSAVFCGHGGADRRVWRAWTGRFCAKRLPRWLMPVFTLVLTSVLAGAATAPFAAATFNRFTDYGLLANLLTVPMMSLLMAAGAMAALLAPLGLSGPALWVMEQAGRWILFIAHWVAGLEGAVTPIVQPGPWVIPLVTLAGAWADSVAWPAALGGGGAALVGVGAVDGARSAGVADLRRWRAGRAAGRRGPRAVSGARCGICRRIVVARRWRSGFADRGLCPGRLYRAKGRARVLSLAIGAVWR